jgi:hypothetical protein
MASWKIPFAWKLIDQNLKIVAKKDLLQIFKKNSKIIFRQIKQGNINYGFLSTTIKTNFCFGLRFRRYRRTNFNTWINFNLMVTKELTNLRCWFWKSMAEIVRWGPCANTTCISMCLASLQLPFFFKSSIISLLPSQFLLHFFFFFH